MVDILCILQYIAKDDVNDVAKLLYRQESILCFKDGAGRCSTYLELTIA